MKFSFCRHEPHQSYTDPLKDKAIPQIYAPFTNTLIFTRKKVHLRTAKVGSHFTVPSSDNIMFKIYYLDQMLTIYTMLLLSPGLKQPLLQTVMMFLQCYDSAHLSYPEAL